MNIVLLKILAIYFLHFVMSQVCELMSAITHPLYDYRYIYYHTVGKNSEPDLPFHGSTENIFENISHCGNPAIDVNEAIINGQDAPEKAWPWQVLVVMRNRNNHTQVCGGSLISESWVLTAAHCVVDIKVAAFLDVSVRVYLGVTDLNTLNVEENFRRNDSGIRRRKSPKIIAHKGYISHHVSDIALIKLDTPVEFTDYVRPICLPKPGQRFDGEQAGDCYATGWGKFDYFQEAKAVLQQIKVTVMPQSLCIYSWGVFGAEIYDRRVLCLDLNDARSGVCFGDSGGPLACKVDGRFVLAGVAHAVPKGFNCTYNFFPSLFMRVTEHLEWIAFHIKENE